MFEVNVNKCDGGRGEGEEGTHLRFGVLIKGIIMLTVLLG